MTQDTRILVVEADEQLDQFLTESIEQFIGGETTNVRVREVDPNTVSDTDLLDS